MSRIDVYRCADCGGSEVQQQRWIDINSGEAVGPDKEFYWCDSCDSTIKKLLKPGEPGPDDPKPGDTVKGFWATHEAFSEKVWCGTTLRQAADTLDSLLNFSDEEKQVGEKITLEVGEMTIEEGADEPA